MSKKHEKQKLQLVPKHKRTSQVVPKDDEHYEFLEHFEQHGWAILPNAIPMDLVKQAKQEIQASLTQISSFDMNDTATWKHFHLIIMDFVNFIICQHFIKCDSMHPCTRYFANYTIRTRFCVPLIVAV